MASEADVRFIKPGVGYHIYIKMIENPVFHDKSNHIEIQYFYIRDMMQKGAIKLQYVSTDEQVFEC